MSLVLARRALAHYPINQPQCTFLTHTNNYVYRVNDAVGKQYALRICNPNHDHDLLQREISWLDALHHDTDLHIPGPIPTHDGELFTLLNGAGDESRYVMLFSWVAGEPENDHLTPGHVFAVGAFIAHLHHHAETFSWPEYLTPPRLDADAPPSAFFFRDIAQNAYSVEELALFDRAVIRIKDMMREIDGITHVSQPVSGIIHGDMHPGNFLYTRHGDQWTIGLIDFEELRWGYFYYDLATMMIGFENAPNQAELDAALLDGYASVRPLPPDCARYLPMFIIRRHIHTVNWIVAWDDPHHMAFGPPFLRRTVEQVRAFLAE